MKIFLRVVLALAVLWSAWWWGAGYLLRTSLAMWFAAQEAQGWQADYAAIETDGYPLRHRTAIYNPALADPATGTAWRAAFLAFESPAYWPGDMTVIFPDTAQRISYFDRSIDLVASDMAADLTLRPGPALELDRMALTSGPWALTMGEATVAVAQALILVMDRQDVAEVYAVDIAAEGFAPGPQLRRAIRGPEGLPQAFDTLILTMTVQFNRPWDRSAIERSRPQPRAIDLALLNIEWGAMEIEATGQLDVDAEGVPEGHIALQVNNWRDMLAMAETSGALPSSLADTAERALNLLSGLGGNPNRLDVKLNLRDGFLALGPIPLGPAPRLILR